MNTITIYRAINKHELTETADLNDMTVDEILAAVEREVDFLMHEGTKWDFEIDNWPGLLLGPGGRRAIVSLTAYDDWKVFDTGCYIWAVAKINKRVRVKIERTIAE
jgi:hypothetical protein